MKHEAMQFEPEHTLPVAHELPWLTLLHAVNARVGSQVWHGFAVLMVPEAWSTPAMRHPGAQVTPVPTYPLLHAHVRLPDVLVQVAPVGAQPPLLVAHSSMSVQVVPVPVNPVKHAHVRAPCVLVQVALLEQPPLLVRHSLMSLHMTPSPW